MSTPLVNAPAAPPRAVTVPGTARAAGAVRRPSVPEPSRSAKQRAAAILEVLAGTRTPAEAAQALDLSLQRYYLLEEKALVGLVSACEPAPRGPGGNEARRWAALERECQRWRQESARQQALVRAAQRTIGLVPPAPPPAKDKGKKRRRHRPVVRALQAAARLRQEAPAGEASGEAPSTTNPSAS